MGLIYSEAVAVIGWLGSPTKDALEKFPIAKEWLRSIKDQPRRSLRPVSSGLAEALTNVVFRISFQPYWERLWIVQEIAKAASIRYWYGDWTFTPNELAFVYTAWREHDAKKKFSATKYIESQSFPRKLSPQISLISDRLFDLRKMTSGSENWEYASFEDLVHIAQSSKATVARDKVYGLLAVLPKCIACAIHPDYSSHVTLSETCEFFQNLHLEPRQFEHHSANSFRNAPHQRYA